MAYCSKKYRHLKSKILHKVNRLLFTFFLSIFDIFFSILPVQGFQNKFKISCCFILWIRDFIKKFCNTIVFFFKKKLRYLKSKISTKLHHLLFDFYFFLEFLAFFFSISPIETCPKIMEFFVLFYWKGQRFYQRFLENSKSSFKTNIDM